MGISALEHRLAMYSATAGAVILGGAAAEAAIQHVDIDPDIVLNIPAVQMLDIDVDGVLDLGLTLFNTTGAWNSSTTGSGSAAIRHRTYGKVRGAVSMQPMISASGANHMLVKAGSFVTTSGGGSAFQYRQAAAIVHNGLISSGIGQGTEQWGIPAARAAFNRLNAVGRSAHTTGSGWILTYNNTNSTLSGPWLGQAGRHVGMRLRVGGDVHFAWVRLTVNADSTQVTIHDMAYQDRAGTPILAGDIGNCISQNRLFTVSANDASIPGGTFNAKPKVSGIYFDRISGKEKKATAKAVGLLPSPALDCEWGKRIALWDKAGLKESYKIGNGALVYLAANPIFPLPLDLRLDSKDRVGQADIADVDLYPPQISAMYNQLGQRVQHAQAGSQITVIGSHFGKKAPKAWIEYTSNGVIKMLKLKLVRRRHLDLKGVPLKSAMDQRSGASGIDLEIPAKLPWVPGPGGNHALVIDNGAGIAAVSFDIR